MPSGFADVAEDAAAAPPPAPPRGWYADPSTRAQWRFWSGDAWTEYRHPRDPGHQVPYVPEGGTIPAAAPDPVPPTRPADLRSRIPAQSVIEKLIELERTRDHAEQYPWHTGAVGERYVAGLLEDLGPEWTVLHSVPVGTDGSDIDHVLIGPPGVFTVNTKHHPGARVWVASRALRVNNHPQRYLFNAVHEADRAARLLSEASGLTVEVIGIIAIVGASVTIKERPESDTAHIVVVPASSLLQALQVRRAYSDEQVARIVAAAVRPETWSASPQRADVAPSTLLAEFSVIDGRIRREGPPTPVAARTPRPSERTRAPSARPASRSSGRRKSGCASVVLSLAATAALALVVVWAFTTLLPQLAQNAISTSQARAAERAELASLTASANAAASALEDLTAGGPRPASLTITPGDALLVTDGGVVLADLPDGTTGTYAVSADGLSYELTLVAAEYGSTVTVTPERGVVVPDE